MKVIPLRGKRTEKKKRTIEDTERKSGQKLAQRDNGGEAISTGDEGGLPPHSVRGKGDEGEQRDRVAARW